jgi:hypothetical protein
VLAVSFPTLAIATSGADAEAPSEDQLKAALLLNFPKYVESPLGAGEPFGG